MTDLEEELLKALTESILDPCEHWIAQMEAHPNLIPCFWTCPCSRTYSQVLQNAEEATSAPTNWDGSLRG